MHTLGCVSPPLTFSKARMMPGTNSSNGSTTKIEAKTQGLVIDETGSIKNVLVIGVSWTSLVQVNLPTV
jgi:hypothetical protein